VLAQFAFAAVEDVAAEVVAAFLEVADPLDLAAVWRLDHAEKTALPAGAYTKSRHSRARASASSPPIACPPRQHGERAA